MHRELGAQFLLTRMEIAHISFLPAQHRINNHKCGTGNVRQITLVTGSERTLLRSHTEPEEIFLCCSCSSYLAFTRLMTSLNMQQLNTNQPAGFVLCKNMKNKRLNFTFTGNNANTNTVTCLAPSIASIRAQFSTDGLL